MKAGLGSQLCPSFLPPPHAEGFRLPLSPTPTHALHVTANPSRSYVPSFGHLEGDQPLFLSCRRP